MPMITNAARALVAATLSSSPLISEPLSKRFGFTRVRSWAHGTATGRLQGIPYAAPPVGDLRWKPPQPAPHWEGLRDATKFGLACPSRRPAPRPSKSGVRIV